jgi:hypothetical protein
LEKGNLQPVTFIKEGREEKMFVTANPQYKTLDLYDSNGISGARADARISA